MVSREIEAFLVLADERHFGRAAQRLGVSPGRVSQLVTSLERRTGRQLVVRSSRAVQLNAAGERLLAQARTGYQQLEQALAATRAAARQRSGVLRLGTSVWLDPAAGTSLAEAFEHRHPGWRAECVPVRPADLPRPLADGDVDVLVLLVEDCPAPVPAPPGIALGPVLARHERVLLVPAGHHLAQRPVLTPADLAGHDLAGFPDHLSAPPGGACAAGHRSPGGRLTQALEPHDAFDLVVRRQLLFLSAAGTVSLFGKADVARVAVTGFPLLHTALARRAGDPSPMVSAFTAMAEQFATADR